jgi:hypothetical protein
MTLRVITSELTKFLRSPLEGHAENSREVNERQYCTGGPPALSMLPQILLPISTLSSHKAMATIDYDIASPLP